jgi:hypothetical protein
MSDSSDSSALLAQILATLKNVQDEQKTLASSVDAINGRVNALADVKELKEAARPKTPAQKPAQQTPSSPSKDEKSPPSEVSVPKKPTGTTSRIILTTYPGQSGIDPIIMNWGEKDPAQRGPVVVGRGSSTVRRRNGTVISQSGDYSVTRLTTRVTEWSPDLRCVIPLYYGLANHWCL